MLAGAEVLRTFEVPRRLPRAAVVIGSVALVLVVAHTLAVNLAGARRGRRQPARVRGVGPHPAQRPRARRRPRRPPRRGVPDRQPAAGRARRSTRSRRSTTRCTPPPRCCERPSTPRRTADGTLWDGTRRRRHGAAQLAGPADDRCRARGAVTGTVTPGTDPVRLRRAGRRRRARPP